MFENPLVPAAYDRSANKSWDSVVFRSGRFVQTAELNEQASLASRRLRRVGNMTAKDGDRIEGGDIVVQIATDGSGTCSLAAGKLYVAGDVRDIPARVVAVPNFIGEVVIGAVLRTTVVTEAQDPDLLGIVPGTEGEGEPGAARLVVTLQWARQGEFPDVEFFSVYNLLDGAPISQTPPPVLSGVQSQIALYDFEALGNYIVDNVDASILGDCEVRALGKIGINQAFSISAGSANIKGFKRKRESAITHLEPEEFDPEIVSAEPHNFSGPTGGTTVVTINRAPVHSVQSVIVVKETTVSLVRSTTPNTADATGVSAVVQVVEVKQGGTTYTSPADFTLVGDTISWAPGGAEPAAGSSYAVKLRYNSAVTPDAVTPTTVTVSGGVNGTNVLISYTAKMPRIDALCFDASGRPVYLKGISARRNGRAPAVPTTLLKLADIYNDWLTMPRVENTGTRNFNFDKQRRMFELLLRLADQLDRNSMQTTVTARDAVDADGIFTDNFIDDFYRDAGAAQTAAVNKGVLQLPIANVLMQRAITAPQTLAYTDEVIVSQPLRTSSVKINEYANFVAQPAGMKLNPAVDFWTEQVTQWTSPVTREFTTAPDEPPGSTTLDEVTEIRREAAPTLRTISVTATMEGFGVGENLSVLTFAGIDVKPAGTQTADGQGVLAVTFNIPAGVPAGRQRVRAEGAAGSFAEAIFVGEGTVDINTMRRVTLVARAAPAPVINIINNITNIQNITNVVETVIAQQQAVQQAVDPWWTSGSNSESGGGNGGQSGDPWAQSFSLPSPRALTGVNFRFAAIGDRTKGVRVQLVTMWNGYPTRDVIAEDFINMATVQIGDLVQARFSIPVWLPADRLYAFVWMTDDAEHAIFVSRLGDIEQETQQRVSSQPYTIGDGFSGSNSASWKLHPDIDTHMEIVVARYTEAIRTVPVWTGALNLISDFQVRGAIELPNERAKARFELVRANGDVIKLAPGQNVEFADYVSENVTVRAILEGDETVAPILWPGVLIVGGRIASSGTYISKLIQMLPTNSTVRALFKALLPAGASATIDVDSDGNGNWLALSPNGSRVVGEGWTEPKFQRTGYAASAGRIRVTLTGGPAARAAIAQLRAYPF